MFSEQRSVFILFFSLLFVYLVTGLLSLCSVDIFIVVKLTVKDAEGSGRGICRIFVFMLYLSRVPLIPNVHFWILLHQHSAVLQNLL